MIPLSSELAPEYDSTVYPEPYLAPASESKDEALKRLLRQYAEIYRRLERGAPSTSLQ